MSAPRPLELLAPAKNAETAIEAIRHGADAVYIGGPAFGARAAAGNSVEEIARVTEYAHRFHARVYVTVNTILYPSELEDAKVLVRKLHSAGADALIVQDMAFAEMRDELPPIALHASTQCDIRTPEKAAALARAGFEQLVLPRELSLEETAAVRRAVPSGTELEAFVHGALCVSYSGDCQAGFVAMGRSANRGECPQMCRLQYSLTDREGRELAPPAHYLSLRDLNRLDTLGKMAAAGVSSFKIEGRLKDVNYVRNVVAAYSDALDALVRANPDKYVRASHGSVRRDFTPDLSRTFNRGYTPYFLNGRLRNGMKMASAASPKWAGRPVGTVVSAPDSRKGYSFTVRLTDTLANGDGLTYTRPDGTFEGFRLNRVEGNRLFPASEVKVRPGMTLFRNIDKAFLDSVERSDTRRVIPVDMRLEREGDSSVRLSVEAPGGLRGEATASVGLQEARTPQEEGRKRTLSRLGDTVYELRDLRDSLRALFIPVSVLSDLRRRATADLDAAYSRSLPVPARSFPQADTLNLKLDYHANVANPLARKFYEDRGCRVEQEAVERELPEGELRVMTTRYCLRRELGECLRENPAGRFPKGPLYLRSTKDARLRYRLDFDCAKCEMHLIREKNSQSR